MTVVTVLTAGRKTDGYGAEVLDWDAATSRDLPVLAVAPRLAQEDHTLGRRGSLIGLSVWAPPGTRVGAQERIRVDGVIYEIDGEPGAWSSPHSGRTPGVEIALKRVEG